MGARPGIRTWAVVVLAALTIAYRGIDRTQNSSGRILDLGFEAHQVAEGVLLRRSAAASYSPHPAGQFLQDGDIVDAVTVGAQRAAVRTRTELADALRPLENGEPWIAHVVRPEVGRVDVPLPAVTSPWPFSWIEFALPVGFTAVTVVTALLLVWLRPGDHVAFLGAMLFLCLGYVLGTPLQGLPSPVRESVAVLQGTCTTFLPYLFLRFFSLFPSPGWLARRLSWAFTPLLVVSGLAAVAVTSQTLVEVDALSEAWRIPVRPKLALALPVIFLLMVGGGALSLIAQYRFAPTASARRRLGIVVAGLTVGIGPLFTYFVAAGIAGSTASPGWFWAAVAVVICLPIFPASFAYAVVRHRVLGVNAIVRRGAKYLLVSRGLIALEVLLAVGVLYATALWVGGTDVTQRYPAGATLALAFVAGLALWGAVRLNRVIQPAIDRRFFRDDYESGPVLAELALEVRRLAPDPVAVLTHVANVLAEALRCSAQGVVMLQREDGETDAPPVAEVVPVGAAEPDVRSAMEHALVVLGRDAQFLHWLEGRPPGATVVVDATDPVPWRPHEPRPERWHPSMVAPIAGDTTVVAALLLGEKLSEEPFSRRDRALITAAASQAAIALEYGRLIRQAAEQESFRRDLEVAQQVQTHLFPRKPPQVQGLEFSGACQPARTIGGDYFDAIELPGGRMAVAAGDVVGKGVGAALLMSNLQATLRTLLAHVDGLDAVVEGVNRSVIASTEPGKFVTLFVAVADPARGTLTYVNAGHNPPLLRRADGATESLDPTGMAVALLPQAKYATARVGFGAGDTLLVFTDGVTEAMDTGGEFYGDERLSALLRGWESGPAEALRDRVLADVEAFTGGAPPHDDITVVVVRNVAGARGAAGPRP